MKKIFNLVLLAVAAAPLFANAQWNAVRFDQANFFTRVQAVTDNDAFVIGMEPFGASFLLRTDDGGETWDSVPFNTASTTYQINELHFADLNNGFAAGYKNNATQALLKSSDHGNTWIDVTPEPASLEPISTVFFVNAQRGFATAGTKWYATENGGLDWTAWTVNFIASDLNFSDANIGYAVGTVDGAAALLKTTDGGASWLTLLTNTDPSFFGSAFDNINAVTADMTFMRQQWTNVLYRTLDGGATWDTIACDSVWHIVDFHFNDKNNGCILSDVGQLFSTTDGGVSWTLDYSAEWGVYGPSVMLNSLSFSNGVGYVCGSNGLIKRFVKSQVNNVVEIERIALRVYPNPCHGVTNLNIATAGFEGACELMISNNIGQAVHKQTITNVTHQGVLNITGLQLAVGTYTVALRNNRQKQATTLVVN